MIVEQSNKLLMHYGCHTALGTKLQTSIKLLLMELGITFQPLLLSYTNFGNMVIISWLKQVWEKLNKFKFVVTIHNLRLMYPQEGDNWLMARLILVGYRDDDLLMLNRVRKHQQVLFLSNILGAGGELLDKQYLQKQRETDCWSTMKFPWEIVTEVEMLLWRTAIIQVVAAGPACNRLGAFIKKSHKIWDWRIQEEAGWLYRCNGNTVEVMQLVRRGRYGSPWQSRSRQMRGDYATVKELRPGVWKVCLAASLPFWPGSPTTFLDVLQGWGHTWFWNEMKVVGGTDWLSQAIAGGILRWLIYPGALTGNMLRCLHTRVQAQWRVCNRGIPRSLD
jgi:hypothetical protein